MANARGGAPAGASDAAETETAVSCRHPVHTECRSWRCHTQWRRIAAIPRVEHGRAIDVPRTSVSDALMTYGEPMPSVKAAG